MTQFENLKDTMLIRDRVYDALRREILSGGFAPGETLNILGLSKQMGVSCAPVREALNMLNKDGLVDLMPYKKASVAMGTDADYKAAFDLRLMLEPYALLQSIDMIPGSEIRAMELMKKVGIPNAENRFDDYPFQYSGGMRQRIVIAIALSCQPKILICDEPTTALDVTIQAQILKLIKDLQKEFGYTIVFITHDLGVVANIADRVAVLYAGQIVELGTVEDVFYDPRHPYTWAMLSSLPQLAQRNTELYSITGTPPSLYNKIVGDPFAPRNPYCLKIDTLQDAPMFKVSDTHYAKTWLLDPRAPKIEKPEIICNLHEKLVEAFNI